MSIAFSPVIDEQLIGEETLQRNRTEGRGQGPEGTRCAALDLLAAGFEVDSKGAAVALHDKDIAGAGVVHV